MEELVNAPNTRCINDSKYLTSAMKLTFEKGNNKSLVDNIIRLMLDDDTLRIDGLITFNARDFYDVCAIRNIELISD